MSSRRRALYNITPQAEPSIVPLARVSKRESPTPANTIAERIAQYTVRPEHIDVTGRTRTWALLTPSGEKCGEITTRRGAERIAELLNNPACAQYEPTP